LFFLFLERFTPVDKFFVEVSKWQAVLILDYAFLRFVGVAVLVISLDVFELGEALAIFVFLLFLLLLLRVEVGFDVVDEVSLAGVRVDLVLFEEADDLLETCHQFVAHLLHVLEDFLVFVLFVHAV